jgi:hypothetical protein
VQSNLLFKAILNGIPRPPKCPPNHTHLIPLEPSIGRENWGEFSKLIIGNKHTHPKKEKGGEE